MATAKRLNEQIDDITKCPICTETLTDAKVLPCVHSFCLKCLCKYGKDNKPGDEVSCPLCRKNFTLRAGGFEALPDNFFVNNLVLINKTSYREIPDKPVNCEGCQEYELKIDATSYCIECEEHFCDKCVQRHSKKKVLKSHKIVSVEEKPSQEELIKMAVSYCDQHPNKEIEFYCCDCKTTCCVVCYVDKHKEHKCRDVNESAKELLIQVNEDIVKMTDCVEQSQDKLKKLDASEKSFIEKAELVERAISQKYDELRALLDKHQRELMTELNEIKAKHLKETSSRRDEQERHLVMVESFKKYCEEMKDKGTACDISRAAEDLHKRAVELVNSHEEDKDSILQQEVELKFVPSTTTSTGVKNLLGEIQCEVVGQRLEIDVSLFLRNPQIVKVIEQSTDVEGLAVLRNEIFVGLLKSNQLNVYNSQDFSLLRNITVSEMKTTSCLAACPKNNCLYTLPKAFGS